MTPSTDHRPRNQRADPQLADTRSAGFATAARVQSRAVADSADEREDQAFIDAIAWNPKPASQS
jgi:hypothetical protein